MFDKDLFYSLCDKYGVKLSDRYDNPILNVNGEIREITEMDIRELLHKNDVGEYDTER